MPGFIFHLLHGKMITDRNNIIFTEDENKQFTMGLLMPDSKKVRKTDDGDTHFYNEKQEGKILKVPDLSRFRYYQFMDNPFVIGYLAHLYLDKLFFEEFFTCYVKFLDIEGNVTKEEKDVHSVFLINSKETISVSDLFSEKYLYGDYTILNRYLIDKYKLKPANYVEVANPIKEIDITDFKYIQYSLKHFVEASIQGSKTKVFTIESVERALERYAFGFEQWVEGIKIK